MPLTLLSSLEAFLARFEQSQASLAALLAGRREALERRDAAGLMQLAESELLVTQELEHLVAQRARILRDARRRGLPGETLKQLSGAIARTAADARVRAAAEAVHLRCQAAERRAWQQRREGWTHWIIASRNVAHYTELIDLIANHGHPPPTYDGTHHEPGGALLDAAA
jgi:hypothetical protein